MTTLYIYGGPTKRLLIQQAYSECGQSPDEFEVSNEDYADALTKLTGLMYEWRDGEGIDLGFNFPANGQGTPEDESGIPAAAQQVVATALALRLAPSIGKTIAGEARVALARSIDLLRAKYRVVPAMQLNGRTSRGTGNRRWSAWYSPYYQPQDDDAPTPSYPSS